MEAQISECLEKIKRRMEYKLKNEKETFDKVILAILDRVEQSDVDTFTINFKNLEDICGGEDDDLIDVVEFCSDHNEDILIYLKAKLGKYYDITENRIIFGFDFKTAFRMI